MYTNTNNLIKIKEYNMYMIFLFIYSISIAYIKTLNFENVFLVNALQHLSQ